MLVYRQLLWIETVVDDGLLLLGAEVPRIVGTENTLLNWLNHLHLHPASFFLILIGVSVIWMAVSYYSSWKQQRTAASSMIRAINDTARASHQTTLHLDGSNSNISSTQVCTDLGHFSTAKRQTSVVTSSGGRNFSGLARIAPVSYNTLQRNGMLYPDGTPTKNYSPGSKKRSGLTLGR